MRNGVIGVYEVRQTQKELPSSVQLLQVGVDTGSDRR